RAYPASGAHVSRWEQVDDLLDAPPVRRSTPPPRPRASLWEEVHVDELIEVTQPTAPWSEPLPEPSPWPTPGPAARRAQAPTPRPPAPAPQPPAPIAPAAPPPTTGTAIGSPGHRLFVDGRLVNGWKAEGSCGPHTFKFGAKGKLRTVDVPCGGEVTIVP